MIGVKVEIMRYMGDDPQPGIVECELVDAHGEVWSFIEKTAVVRAMSLNEHTSYPQGGLIACEIVGRNYEAAEIVSFRINTEKPWHIESTNGSTEFDVPPDLIVEFN